MAPDKLQIRVLSNCNACKRRVAIIKAAEYMANRKYVY